MLNFEVKYYVECDEDEIVANCNPTMTDEEIDEQINTIIARYDDCDYYPLLGYIVDIREAVKQKLKRL